MKTKKQIGIVGCGAVTEVCHLPAAKHSQEVEIVALADLNVERARSLGERFGVAHYDDCSKLFGKVEGVIVATPNYLHAPVAAAFLERGIPVLIEKPLALTSDEAHRLIETAYASHTPLQAGYMYRFCAGARVVKKAIEAGWLGKLTRFSLECGTVYSW